jgi:hypothetical protein
VITNNTVRGGWRKSSHSGNSGNCVEVATTLPGAVSVRDSKNDQGPEIAFTTGAWSAFLAGIKHGEFAP